MIEPAIILRFFAIPGIVKVTPGAAITFRYKQDYITLAGRKGKAPEVIDSSFPVQGRIQNA